ncbi:MAG TPA: DUF1924 domain-containing protein [Ramlibacter sp.]|nr:DUF1924 domain-containing protein [Ramlibacter sp.]
MKPSTRARARATVIAVALAGLAAAARAATPAQLLSGYATQAGTAPSPVRGQQCFGTPHGHEWSCSTCHGTPPIRTGKHARTGREIAPLAPAFNAGRFTDAAFSDKWFRRNCNDVVGRECTPGEKADILSWLLTLKP